VEEKMTWDERAVQAFQKSPQVSSMSTWLRVGRLPMIKVSEHDLGEFHLRAAAIGWGWNRETI
jgi:hypothetical protein